MTGPDERVRIACGETAKRDRVEQAARKAP
jgi:hypothetical protein